MASLFITLDGVVEAPNEWSFEHFDEGMMAAMQTQLAQLDTVLLGRVTYEEWVGYWPTATDEPFASFINNVPKFVFSTTLERVGWQNATLISGNTADAIQQLKQQPGKNMASRQPGPGALPAASGPAGYAVPPVLSGHRRARQAPLRGGRRAEAHAPRRQRDLTDRRGDHDLHAPPPSANVAGGSE